MLASIFGCPEISDRHFRPGRWLVNTSCHETTIGGFCGVDQRIEECPCHRHVEPMWHLLQSRYSRDKCSIPPSPHALSLGLTRLD
jgi:hypothetical protein